MTDECPNVAFSFHITLQYGIRYKISEFLKEEMMTPTKLIATFALAATAFVAEQTIETALDPLKPSYIGMRVLGETFQHKYIPNYFTLTDGQASPYDYYLRDKFIDNPQLAYKVLRDL